MIRPIFVDERLGEVNGEFAARYDIVARDGTVVAGDAQLRLKNPVAREGTPLNAANLNNMFDFDNFESMRGHRKVTQVTPEAVTETVTAAGSDTVNARRVTTFPEEGVVRVATTVYSDDGSTVLRETVAEVVVGDEVVEVVS